MCAAPLRGGSWHAALAEWVVATAAISVASRSQPWALESGSLESGPPESWPLRHRLLLSALAATVHLPGEQRLEAMALAREQRSASRVARFVEAALREEGRRRLALKALYAAVEPSIEGGAGP